jgi:hypothetical protein
MAAFQKRLLYLRKYVGYWYLYLQIKIKLFVTTKFDKDPDYKNVRQKIIFTMEFGMVNSLLGDSS